MDFKYLRKNEGFSLIELLIYVSVSSTLLLIVVAFARDVLRARNKIAIESKVEQNARHAMARMVNEIRFANDVIVIDQNTLQLTVSDELRNPILFDLMDGVLFMSENGADALAITGNDVKVGDVLFEDRTTPNSADIIRISLAVTQPDENLSIDSQASINLETYVTVR